MTKQEQFEELVTTANIVSRSSTFMFDMKKVLFGELQLHLQGALPKYPVMVLGYGSGQMHVLARVFLVETDKEANFVCSRLEAVFKRLHGAMLEQGGEGHEFVLSISTMNKENSILFYPDAVRQWEMDNIGGPNRKKLLKARGIG